MKEPTFDQYGYPTEEALAVLENWECQPDRPVAEQVKEWLEYARSCWNYADCVREIGGRVYIFHTVGWSGNESVIAAMKQNPLFWSLAFELHAKGGLYVLALPERV